MHLSFKRYWWNSAIRYLVLTNLGPAKSEKGRINRSWPRRKWGYAQFDEL